MITANVIHRMFHLKSTMSGTAFAVDVDGRQYLVTARHVVKELEPGGSISLLHQRIWKTLTVEIVGVGSDKIDVAVLACPIQLAPTLRLHPSSDGMVLGQQVHMLGFPYGWDTGQEGVNRDFPVPLVKGGIASTLPFGDPKQFFIDALGNRGFSGGPVVFTPEGGEPTRLQVAGIVTHVPPPRPRLEPVLDENGEPIRDAKGRPAAYFSENPGFVAAFDIQHALDQIAANPIGYQMGAYED